MNKWRNNITKKKKKTPQKKHPNRDILIIVLGRFLIILKEF